MPNVFTHDPNCVALWKFEAGALTTDSIGTNTLTNHGVAEDAVNFKQGACAADFESTESDYMYRSDANLSAGFPLKSGDTSKKYSFAFWAKFESFTAIRYLFSKGYASLYGIDLQVSATGVLSLSTYGSWNIATLVTGRWYHIGISGDAIAKTATARIWDDIAGSAATYTHTYSGESGNSTYDFVIGSIYNKSTCFLDGLIDELVVFKDVKTVADFDLIRDGWYGAPLLAGTIAAVSELQGNITGVSTLLVGTVPAVASVTGYLTGGAVALGTATADAASGVSGTLTLILGVTWPIPASTGGWELSGAGVVTTYTPVPVGSGIGGWAIGGAGVWASSTPTDTEVPADVEPTGFYLGGGAAAGEPEVISTIPPSDEIVTDGAPYLYCGPSATGNATTSEPHQDVIEPEGGFLFGGEGVWSQVAAADLPSAVLVPTGGWVLSGSGLTLDPAVAPTATVLVGAGGWKMGGRRADPIEVTYPGSFDRIIEETIAFEIGGDGLPECTYPESTVIETLGGFFLLAGAGLCTSKMPPVMPIVTGEGGFVLAGATPAEVFEAWVLNGQAFEPSVFSGFNFNSFAQHNGQTYAAGAAGIYLLGGEHDAGEAIRTGARVGPVNLGSDHDKRLRSIHYGGKAGPNMKIRVRANDTPGSPGPSGVFAPQRDDNQLVVSRDIQGEEFTFDFMDFEELSGVEITPLRLARR